MGKTIIQTIGPLYGEVVNGTVFGRPNGSIFVPSSNEIDATTTAGYVRYLKTSWGTEYNILCSNAGAWGTAYLLKSVAKAQDVASYIQYQISESSDFTDYKTYTFDAGRFNVSEGYVAKTDTLTIVNGETYYVRAQLMSASGVAVATSPVFEVEGWVSE